MTRGPGAFAVACGVAMFVVACGGAAPAARGPAPLADAGASATDDGGVDASIASLDALAARGTAEAPLMRELARFERASPRTADVRAADRDLCVRAFFAATAPVKVSFVDGTGAARGDPTTAASGSVPPRGPVCLQKGETAHLVFEGGTSLLVRAVVLGAP